MKTEKQIKEKLELFDKLGSNAVDEMITLLRKDEKRFGKGRIMSHSLK